MKNRVRCAPFSVPSWALYSGAIATETILVDQLSVATNVRKWIDCGVTFVRLLMSASTNCCLLKLAVRIGG